MPRKQRVRVNVGEMLNLDNHEHLKQAIGATLANGPYSSEFAGLSETARDRLSDALAREVEFARVKVPGKREETKRDEAKRATWSGEEPGAAWTRQAFMIGVTHALREANLPIKKWRDVKSISHKDIYESKYFEIVRQLGRIAEVRLPRDLTRLAMQVGESSLELVKHRGHKPLYDINL